MIGLGWAMMYNSIIEKYIDNKNIDNNNEITKITKTNIIIVNKI
jgi:hypothetical protein